MNTSMRKHGHRRTYGMTLLEVLIVLATILILVGAVITAGKTLQERAAVDLTRSLLEVLDTALQQYYDDFGTFPFVTEKDITADGVIDPYNGAHLIYDIKGSSPLNPTLSAEPPLHAGVDPADPSLPVQVSSASSLSLFYFLDKNPSSRSIADAVSESLVTSKVLGGSPVMLTFGAQTLDLPRYIDSWQTSIRYQCTDGGSFPVLTSAGPDKIFNTADDVTNQ